MEKIVACCEAQRDLPLLNEMLTGKLGMFAIIDAIIDKYSSIVSNLLIIFLPDFHFRFAFVCLGCPHQLFWICHNFDIGLNLRIYPIKANRY